MAWWQDILNIKAKTDNLPATPASEAGKLSEQPTVPVNLNAIAGGETDILNLSTAGTRYVLRKLTLKSVDPGANNVTVRLYELVNNASTNTVSHTISTLNFTTYFTLMDMFGVEAVAGDNIRITVQASGGGPYAVTGQYSFARTG